MGMTDNTKMLIKAISENNLPAARKCAIACLSEDTTAKNKNFVNRYKPILENSASVIELPSNLKYKLIALDLQDSFREDRYYLSKNAKEVYDEIFLKRKVSEKMESLGIRYLNSTLLYGLSGTGKTTFAKYVAYKFQLPYIYLNYSQIIDSYMGKTSSTLNLAFNYVRANPCVFVIDEIDAIAIRRTSSTDSGSDGEMNRITITLMQELDNLPNHVILIAATNRRDRIDEALLRRFTLKKELTIPSDTEKAEMIAQYMSTVPFDLPLSSVKAITAAASTQNDVVDKINIELAKLIEASMI